MGKTLFFGVLIVVIILLVIYFHASRVLRHCELTKEQERRWKFIRITCTVCTLLILVLVFYNR